MFNISCQNNNNSYKPCVLFSYLLVLGVFLNFISWLRFSEQLNVTIHK